VDVVLFWKHNDSTLYGRRNDMIANYLASRSDVARVLVVDAPIDEERLEALAANRDPVRHDRWIAARTRDKAAGRCDRGRIAHTVFVYPRGAHAVDEVDRPGPEFLAAYSEFLAREFDRRQIDPARAVFWVYPKCFPMPALIDRFRPARLVVDVVDDHRAWPGVPEAEQRRLGEHYRDLLSRADLVLANCAPVQQAMAALGREPVLVPNGCDTHLPAATGPVDDALREQQAFSGRTLGFVGNLEAKIDVALLSRLAETFPECRLVLIGSTHANPDVLALRRYPNVRMPGVVPYDGLGAWLSTFDVGLIPHLRMDLTRYMNPLKAYVYLAAGVPIVATAVPNVETIPGLVRVASDHEDFLRQVSAQLAQGRPPRALFDAAVARHDWAGRLARHVDALGLGTLPA
jgi:glycosyltransferase involved in cell wall biosynthesis